MKDPDGLTPKQALFVRHYTSPGDGLFNATQSARMAGYSGSESVLGKTGYENVRKPKVAKAIRRAISEQYSAADLTIERVLADIEHTRQLAIAAGNHTAALKASELHGKYLRMWLERVEHIHTIEDVSNDELVALASRLMGKIDGFDLPAGPGGNGSGESLTPDSPGARKPH